MKAAPEHKIGRSELPTSLHDTSKKKVLAEAPEAVIEQLTSEITRLVEAARRNPREALVTCYNMISEHGESLGSCEAKLALNERLRAETARGLAELKAYDPANIAVVLKAFDVDLAKLTDERAEDPEDPFFKKGYLSDKPVLQKFHQRFRLEAYARVLEAEREYLEEWRDRETGDISTLTKAKELIRELLESQRAGGAASRRPDHHERPLDAAA